MPKPEDLDPAEALSGRIFGGAAAPVAVFASAPLCFPHFPNNNAYFLVRIAFLLTCPLRQPRLHRQGGEGEEEPRPGHHEDPAQRVQADPAVAGVGVAVRAEGAVPVLAVEGLEKPTKVYFLTAGMSFSHEIYMQVSEESAYLKGHFFVHIHQSIFYILHSLACLTMCYCDPMTF